MLIIFNSLKRLCHLGLGLGRNKRRNYFRGENGNYCKECSKGFFLRDGQCLSCEENKPNCAKCSRTSDECIECGACASICPVAAPEQE